MKKTVLTITIALIILNILLAVSVFYTNSAILLSATITIGTIIYHFLIRLLIGFLVPHNFKYTQKFFVQKPFEKRLYSALKVKKWKKYMPSYNPNTYSLNLHTPEEIANTTCRNEVIHEVIIIFSFVPILFGLYAGEYPIFIITSILAAIFDLLFVIMQRFNRPRIVRLIKK